MPIQVFWSVFSFCHVLDLTVFLEGMHLRMLLWVLLIPSAESVTFQHLVFIVNTGCCQSAIKQQYFRNKTELVWTLFVEVRTAVRLFCEDLSEVKKAVHPTGQHWRQLPSHWKVHNLHILTCGTATKTKMIWIILFLNLLASSAEVSVGSLSFLSAVISVEYYL